MIAIEKNVRNGYSGYHAEGTLNSGRAIRNLKKNIDTMVAVIHKIYSGRNLVYNIGYV